MKLEENLLTIKLQCKAYDNDKSYPYKKYTFA